VKRVLLIGIHPDAVDTSDLSLPAALTNEKIAAGIKLTMSDMASRGWMRPFALFVLLRLRPMSKPLSQRDGIAW